MRVLTFMKLDERKKATQTKRKPALNPARVLEKVGIIFCAAATISQQKEVY